MKQILSEEFRRMQKIAGLITENELNEVNPTLDQNKLKNLILAIKQFGGSRSDKRDFSEIAKLLVNNELAKAAEMITLLDTSPNERFYEMMDETYPELWDMLFDAGKDDYIALSTPKADLTENKYRASDFPEITGFEEDNNRIIITFSDNTKDLIEPRNFANKEVGYSKFLELLNTMDTDPKAKQAVSDFLEIKRFNVISTSDINKLLADNGVDEEYFASMGGKEIEGGTEAWLDILSDITGKDAYSGEFSKKDDMKIQTFMNHLSRLGIEVV